MNGLIPNLRTYGFFIYTRTPSLFSKRKQSFDACFSFPDDVKLYLGVLLPQGLRESSNLLVEELLSVSPDPRSLLVLELQQALEQASAERLRSFTGEERRQVINAINRQLKIVRRPRIQLTK